MRTSPSVKNRWCGVTPTEIGSPSALAARSSAISSAVLMWQKCVCRLILPHQRENIRHGLPFGVHGDRFGARPRPVMSGAQILIRDQQVAGRGVVVHLQPAHRADDARILGAVIGLARAEVHAPVAHRARCQRRQLGIERRRVDGSRWRVGHIQHRPVASGQRGRRLAGKRGLVRPVQVAQMYVRIEHARNSEHR